MTSETIRAAVAARVAAAFPTARDVSDLATPVAGVTAAAPAFGVVTERQAADRLTVDSFLAADRVTVAFWRAGGDGLRAQLVNDAAAIFAAVLAAPGDLDGAAAEVQPVGAAFELEDGDARIGRADVAFDVALVVAS